MALGRLEPVSEREEARWEYCQLFLDGRWEYKNQWYYDLTITWMGAEDVIHEALTTTDPRMSRSWAASPWNVALGKLGALGWDLVSVQHSDRAVRSSVAQEYGISPSWAIAYFKRRAKTGRPVNEPRLVI
jgi:hypothetical protein